MTDPHEKAYFDAFIVPRKRQRYAELLEAKDGRAKVLRLLDHFGDLDPRYCQRVKSSDALRLLEELGAPDRCHVMSSDSHIDGREMVLSDALKEIRGCGTILSCLPGVLAYFEGESQYEQYICYRRKSK